MHAVIRCNHISPFDAIYLLPTATDDRVCVTKKISCETQMAKKNVCNTERTELTEIWRLQMNEIHCIYIIDFK